MYDIFASGPFTRLHFYLQDGRLGIAVPRVHPVGERGDLVRTIPGELSIRTHHLL